MLDTGKMHLDPLPGLREHYEIKRDLVKAADERDAAIQAIRDRYSMDELDERSEAYGNAIAEAQSALMGMPAPDLAALRWKLMQLRDGDDGPTACYEAGYVAQTFADIDRLMPAPV
jgi:hypothetical protein